MSSPLDHEFRSRALADSLRNFLLTVNSGAIGLLFSIAGSLIPQGIKADWVIYPTVCFVLGLSFCAISIFLAQHRELKRKKAAENNQQEPDFYFLKRSYVWHISSFLAFIVGVGVALNQLPLLMV